MSPSLDSKFFSVLRRAERDGAHCWISLANVISQSDKEKPLCFKKGLGRAAGCLSFCSMFVAPSPLSTSRVYTIGVDCRLGLLKLPALLLPSEFQVTAGIVAGSDN